MAKGTKCQVCDGTGEYSMERINELWIKFHKNRKKHQCEGHCIHCGQYFSDEGLDWLYDRLENIDKKLEDYFEMIHKIIMAQMHGGLK